MTPKTLVMAGYGLNGEQEMAQGFIMAGSEADIVHINDLIENPERFDDYQILAIPGGFSYGDHTGGGKAYANRIKNNLWEPLLNFTKRDTLTFGICNGFQILVQLGLLPSVNGEYGTRQAALIHNTSQRYQCEWVKMKTEKTNCVFTKGVEMIDLSIGHGEGKFIMPDDQLDALEAANQVVLRYVKPDGSPANGEEPYNPNGASRDIAGVCDPTGRIFGLMPHPDRTLYFTNRPDWAAQKAELLAEGKDVPTEGPGFIIYKNAVNYFS